MRTIKVKKGKSKYKLKSDGDIYIGELIIDFDPSQKTCHIHINKKAVAMKTTMKKLPHYCTPECPIKNKENCNRSWRYCKKYLGEHP